MRGGDAALPKLHWDFLLTWFGRRSSHVYLCAYLYVCDAERCADSSAAAEACSLISLRYASRMTVFTARRYTSAGIVYRSVFVRVSVFMCPSHAGIVSKLLNGSSASGNSGISGKIRVDYFRLGLYPNCGLGKISPRHVDRRRVPEASDSRLLMTTLGDGGRGQVLSSVDRRPSLICCTRRPALYTIRWA